MSNIFITIYGALEQDRSIALWHKIKRDGINMLVAYTRTYVYGQATETEAKEILYECALLGFKVDFERGYVL